MAVSYARGTRVRVRRQLSGPKSSAVRVESGSSLNAFRRRWTISLNGDPIINLQRTRPDLVGLNKRRVPMGGVPREQKMHKEHLPRYHRVYFCVRRLTPTLPQHWRRPCRSWNGSPKHAVSRSRPRSRKFQTAKARFWPWPEPFSSRQSMLDSGLGFSHFH